MPEKSPGFWIAVWAYFRSHPSIDVALASGLMAILRSFQQGKSWKTALFDSCICSFLAFYIHDALGLLGLNTDWSMILGVALGYLGTDFIRSLLMRWAEKKTGVPPDANRR